MLDGYRLMIPGPTQVRQDVLDEMARPIVPHYGPDWTAFYNETMSLLGAVFGTEGKVFALPGSGSAGLDAAFSSTSDKNEQWLVLSNGLFGERIASIARSYRPDAVVVNVPLTEQVTVARLQDALAQYPETTAVAVVHSESSSGLLNPVRELAQVCRERNLLFLVDGISSVGGIELPMDEWGVDICITASQKCLECPPGLALVAVSPRGWERIRNQATPGWYLNLHVWEEYAEKWSDWHPYPITMAVPVFRAMRRALEIILDEGLEARIRRHRESALWVREQLAGLGYPPVFDASIASPTILAFFAAAGLDSADVVRRMRSDHRILIANGMGEFRGKALRIGNMGPQTAKEQMEPVIQALAAIAAK